MLCSASLCGAVAILMVDCMWVEILRFAQDDTGLSWEERLGFCGRDGECGFRTANIFESVVGTHRNGVFPRGNSAE